MKKIIFLLIPILLGGCKKDFNNIVETQPMSYQVVGVNTADQFTYVPSDSLMTANITLNSSANVKDVSINIFTSDNVQLNNSAIQLFDNGKTDQTGDILKGDNTYSNKFPLSHYDPKGTYQIQYYVTDLSGNTKLAAVHSFVFDNGQANIAPVISKLVIPDSIALGVSFIFSVTASDSNGLNDILTVFYKLYRPDGSLVTNTQGISQFPLSDNGDFSVTGDDKANDGIYTNKLTFPNGQPTGSWKFEFQAKDRSGLLSNIITHYIVVK
jgi:hypothetical protein